MKAVVSGTFGKRGYSTGAKAKRALVTAVLAVLALSGCATGTYTVEGDKVHLDCQGDGKTTVVLMAGIGDSTDVWETLRENLGSKVRTCAWDYPGVGKSTGTTKPMTASVAAASLHATLVAAEIDRPVVLVGHSIAGLTVRLFVGLHPKDVSGVVLFDPTVPSIARQYDATDFQPYWDGTVSAREVEQVTAWPDIPFEILRHDSEGYKEEVLETEDEEAWIAGQADFAQLAPAGVVSEVEDAGHYVHLDQPKVAAKAVLRVLRQAS
jgi:pimeloyl-ACP methyl ester carboxylesterase